MSNQYKYIHKADLLITTYLSMSAPQSPSFQSLCSYCSASISCYVFVLSISGNLRGKNFEKENTFLLLQKEANVKKLNPHLRLKNE